MVKRLATCVLLLLAPGASSCTWLVYEDLSEAPLACAAESDCFSGQRCTEGVCVDVDEATEPPPPPSIGPAGGIVNGPGGATLTVPAGALAESVELELVLASATFLPGAFTEVSPALRITPEVTFAVAATLNVPVAAADCPSPCAIYRREGDGTWTARPEPATNPSEPTRVRGSVFGDGVFMAGAPLADGGPTDADGGPPDAGGATPDAGASDAGVDAGVAAPTFAACDLSPDSCTGEEACWPDPFTGVGVCLRRSAGAADEGCACAGRLPDATEDLCLPAALCGAGAVGTACASGTADCDAETTTACVDLGDGAVCTVACATGDDCGAGCCVPAPGGERGLCQASGACGAAANGADCLDDDACGSGTCASPEGLADPVCTDTCTPGAGTCGAGACCYPTDCGGGGLCVDESVCQAVTDLLCDDLCLSNAACGGGSCVNGGCQ